MSLVYNDRAMRYSVRATNPGKIVRLTEAAPGPLSGADLLAFRAQIRECLEREDFASARELLEQAVAEWPADPGLLKLGRALAPPEIQPAPGLDRDRRLELAWLADRANTEKLQGKWIALLGARVVAMADTLKVLLAELGSYPPSESPLIHKVV